MYQERLTKGVEKITFVSRRTRKLGRRTIHPLENFRKNIEKGIQKTIFQGYGMNELYAPDPKEVADLLRGKTSMAESSINEFDKLSIYFRRELLSHNITCREIIDFYQLLEEQIGEKHEICMGRGNAYFNAKNYSKATVEFRRALKLREAEKVLENLVKAYEQKKAFVQIKYYAQWCLKINRKNIFALLSIVRYDEKGKVQGKKLLQKLSEENPSYYYLYFVLSRMQQSQLEREVILRKALQYNQNYFRYYITLADSYEEPWDVIKLKSLEEKYPSTQKFYQYECQLHNERKELKSSVYCMQQSLRRNPHDYFSILSCGIAFEPLNNDLAINYLEKALEINPEMQVARFHLLRVYRKCSQINKIWSVARKGLQFSPQNTMSLFMLALRYYQTGSLGQAIKLFQKMIIEANFYFNVERFGAQCFFRNNDFENGARWALRSIARKGQQIEIMYESVRKYYFQLIPDKLKQKMERKLFMFQWLIECFSLGLEGRWEGLSLDKIKRMFEDCLSDGYSWKKMIMIFKKKEIVKEQFSKRFRYLIFGRLLIESCHHQQAELFYNVLKKITQKHSCQDIFYQQLILFFGDYQNGLISFSLSESRRKYKELFSRIFKNNYEDKNDF